MESELVLIWVIVHGEGVSRGSRPSTPDLVQLHQLGVARLEIRRRDRLLWKAEVTLGHLGRWRGCWVEDTQLLSEVLVWTRVRERMWRIRTSVSFERLAGVHLAWSSARAAHLIELAHGLAHSCISTSLLDQGPLEGEHFGPTRWLLCLGLLGQYVLVSCCERLVMVDWEVRTLLRREN